MFFNDNYRILSVIFENHFNIKDKYISIISQDNICKKLNLGKTKVNHSIKELIIKGYIVKLDNTGKYEVKQKSIDFIKAVEEWEEAISDEI